VPSYISGNKPESQNFIIQAHYLIIPLAILALAQPGAGRVLREQEILTPGIKWI